MENCPIANGSVLMIDRNLVDTPDFLGQGGKASDKINVTVVSSHPFEEGRWRLAVEFDPAFPQIVLEGLFYKDELVVLRPALGSCCSV